MNTAQLMDTFAANHNFCAGEICALPDEQFMHSANGKWTAGQQLAHIILCIQPIAKALASATYIREKFGTVNRELMNNGQVLAMAKEGLQNGGKAPERLLPPVVEVGQKAALMQDLAETLSTIQSRIGNFSEEELDTLVLPHPFMGMLTLREFFYLMTYHPLHHLAQVRVHLGM